MRVRLAIFRLLQQHNPVLAQSDVQVEKIIHQLQNFSFNEFDQKQLKEIRAMSRERVKELDQRIKGA